MSVVLIAEPDQLAALKARPDYTDAQAFTDAETPAALEAIIIGRPDIVAIERIFAKKSRGAALINRIKADTSLETVEIRIVSAESGASKPSGRGGSAATRRQGGAAGDRRRHGHGGGGARRRRWIRRARGARSASRSSRASRC